MMWARFTVFLLLHASLAIIGAAGTDHAVPQTREFWFRLSSSDWWMSDMVDVKDEFQLTGFGFAIRMSWCHALEYMLWLQVEPRFWRCCLVISSPNGCFFFFAADEGARE